MGCGIVGGLSHGSWPTGEGSLPASNHKLVSGIDIELT